MSERFEVRSGGRSGGRIMSIQHAHNAQQAVMDYVRSLGCRDDEIVRLGGGSVSWRGARFQAVLADQGTSS
jgi:hypothetical protein